jgi:hypothetical protein
VVTFDAVDCGGTLPDSSYSGALKGIKQVTFNDRFIFTMSHFAVLDTNESGGPGVFVYYSGLSATNQISFSAVYIKP